MKIFFRSPTRIIIAGFALLILAGTLLLMLPQASFDKSLNFVNAFFTSTSAVCVTGLVVVDTGSFFTFFGQMVLMVLIQIGGIGIMTLSTLFLLIFRGRSSFANHDAMQDTFTPTKDKSPYLILKDVLLFTLIFEGIGTIILFFCFSPGNSVSKALSLAVFHSISAFCNAGFSLFSNSFVDFQHNWIINLVMCILIIAGGLGFIVISDLRQLKLFQRHAWSRLSLNSKLVLFSTVFLLIAGTIIFFFMEQHNTLAHLSIKDGILASFFQMVNTRTSGFNNLPIGNMANETLFIMVIFMFIGASPGSCGGGVKTTTFMTLLILGLSRFKGQNRPQIFNRSISEKSIGKAVSVLLISTAVICIGVIILLMTEIGDVPHFQSRGKFIEYFFEVVSAFGTVGLSMGVTAKISIIGKLILSCIMFIGRLGPLVIVIAVSRSTTLNYYNAEEDIMIG